jgi:hypothetical protein
MEYYELHGYGIGYRWRNGGIIGYGHHYLYLRTGM